jgi:hypothetical protein
MTRLRRLPLFLVPALIGLSPAAISAARDESPAACLSLSEVHGGYPRYRIIGGRRCWYASPRAPERRHERPGRAIDINPDDDPIWHAPESEPVPSSRPTRADCEDQALKLEARDQRGFIKQCMAGKK